VKIALDVQSTLGRKTGIGQYTVQLLAALRRAAPQHEYIPLDWGGDVRMRIDRRLRWQQWIMPQRARAVHADLLHVPGFDAPWLHSCPTVLTVHDLIGALFPHNFPPAAKFYWSRWLPASVRRATHVIADSESTRRDIMRLVGLPGERITVVPLAAGEQYCPVEDPARLAAVRTKYGLAARYLLFVSTIEPRKGLDTLVEAYARLGAAYQEVGLVITGKQGWYAEQLFAQVKRLGLGERVRFTDYVADEDLPALYSAAEALAFPSRYEGFGLTVLEAMACGCPVICSNVSSLPEVAGDAARLVSPDDADALAAALSATLADASLRRAMRARGLAQAARFSWDKTARETLAVYERVAKGNVG
jgi:glycosyltransferase involved in cell wall biosynthesis